MRFSIARTVPQRRRHLSGSASLATPARGTFGPPMPGPPAAGRSPLQAQLAVAIFGVIGARCRAFRRWPGSLATAAPGRNSLRRAALSPMVATLPQSPGAATATGPAGGGRGGFGGGGRAAGGSGAGRRSGECGWWFPARAAAGVLQAQPRGQEVPAPGGGGAWRADFQRLRDPRMAAPTWAPTSRRAWPSKPIPFLLRSPGN